MFDTTTTGKTTRRLRRFALPSALLALGLGGCGGGGSDSGTTVGPAAAASVPDSAYASTPAFMKYIASMQPDDRAEPLLLADKPAPTDDHGQPWDGVQ